MSRKIALLRRRLFVIVTTEPNRLNDRAAGGAFANFLRSSQGQTILNDMGYGRIDGK